jgi:hypothetical protein
MLHLFTGLVVDAVDEIHFTSEKLRLGDNDGNDGGLRVYMRVTVVWLFVFDVYCHGESRNQRQSTRGSVVER